MEKGLTYEELMDFALAHYNDGGDSTYECWDKRTYNEHVEQYGPITKREALRMFRLDNEIRRDMEGWIF